MRIRAAILLLVCSVAFSPLPLRAYTFYRTLKLGDSGEDVRELQRALNRNVTTMLAIEGAGSPGQETVYFGPLTDYAVRRYQKLYAGEILAPLGLDAPTGVVGPATRAFISDGAPALIKQPVTPDPAPPAGVDRVEAPKRPLSQDFFSDLVRGNIDTTAIPSMAEQLALFNPGRASLGGPVISSLSPRSGPDGTTVTIYGTGFTKTGNTIYAGFGIVHDVASADGTTLVFTMRDAFPDDFHPPDFFKKAVPYMLYGIYIQNGNGSSNAAPFFITY